MKKFQDGLSRPPVAPAAAQIPLPTARLLIDVPANFQLVECAANALAPPLPPLVFSPQQSALQVVLYPKVGLEVAPVEALIHQIQPGLPLLVAGLPAAESENAQPGNSAEAVKNPLVAQLLTILGLDEDLSLFYALTDQDAQLSFARSRDAGRFLRSATVFEDLVKCQLRTRAAASQVAAICASLCQHLGAATNLQRFGFPTAAALATASTKLFAQALGHNAALERPLRRLAEFCASGSLYPESLRRAPRSFGDFGKDAEDFNDILGEEIEWQFRVEQLLRRLPSFGPKACDLMLPLLGCHDLLALDIATLRAWQSRFSGKRTSLEKLQPYNKTWEKVQRAMVRRVAPYSLYGGLAQRLLLKTQALAPSPPLRSKANALPICEKCDS